MSLAWMPDLSAPFNASQEDVTTWRHIHFQSIAAFMFLGWDIIITLDDEITFIWTKPHFNLVKWVFLFIRYFAVADALIMQVIMHQIVARYPNAGYLCRPWYALQAITVQTMSCIVDGLTMIRIYALYNRNKGVAILLSVLFISQVSIIVLCVVFATAHLEFDMLCFPVATLRIYLVVALNIMVTQVIILGLAVYQFFTIARPPRLNSAIVTLMFRDGLFTILTVFGLFLFLTIAILVNTRTGVTAHSWYISIISCVGCRVIINMQHLAIRWHDGNLNEATIAEFTTDVAGLSTDFDSHYIRSLPSHTRHHTRPVPDHEDNIQSMKGLDIQEILRDA